MALVVLALYFGRDVLMPLAAALLVSFALVPMVNMLRHWHLGRTVSVAISVVFALTVLIGVVGLVGVQVISLASNLPRYEYNLRYKIRELSISTPGGGFIEQTADVVRRIGNEIERATGGDDKPEGEAASGASPVPGARSPGTAAKPEATKPIPVEVRSPGETPTRTFLNVAWSVLQPVANIGVVLFFVIIVLIQREDLRDRLIRLAGAEDVHRTTEAMNEAASRIGKFLRMQLLLNSLYGLLFGAGLWAVGVPNALLWGLLMGVMKFIPYIGTAIGVFFPLTLAIAVHPGWMLALQVLALFIVIEAVTSYLIEPWAYGTSTGLSPMALLVATTFWTVLWGPVGLLLAAPLTACLVVIGRHIPQFEFLEVLLGNEPALTPHLRFYQRLLAEDTEEATDIAEAYFEEAGRDRLYNELLLPALVLADNDRRRNAIDRERKREIAADILQIVKDAPAWAREPDADGADAPFVLCTGGRSSLDDTAAAMLAASLHDRGVRTISRSLRSVGADQVGRAELTRAAAICICYVDASGAAHARRLLPRLHDHYDRPLIVALLNGQPLTAEAEAALEQAGAAAIATDMVQAATAVATAVPDLVPKPAEAVLHPEPQSTQPVTAAPISASPAVVTG